MNACCIGCSSSPPASPSIVVTSAPSRDAASVRHDSTGRASTCTVHVDARPVLSCLTLAASLDGADVTTIEGLAGGEELHPMQQAFIDHDGFQCGFCTSGQIMSAVALVHEGRAGSDEEIRENMSGNICRCSAYPFIVDAIKDARGVMG